MERDLASVASNRMTLVERELTSVALNGRAVVKPELASVTLNGRAFVPTLKLNVRENGETGPEGGSVTLRGHETSVPLTTRRAVSYGEYSTGAGGEA